MAHIDEEIVDEILDAYNYQDDDGPKKNVKHHYKLKKKPKINFFTIYIYLGFNP